MRTKRLFIFAGLTIILAAAGISFGQARIKRDHLTPKEIDLVRDTQDIDLRVMVLVKAIDRRLQVITGVDPSPPENAKKAVKVTEMFGELPTGTTDQLYWDIEHILDEAINNIDNIATQEPDSKLMRKGVRLLADACQRIMPQLKAFREKATDRKEIEPLTNAMEYAQSVLDSVGKLPAEVETKPIKEEKKKKSKN